MCISYILLCAPSPHRLDIEYRRVRWYCTAKFLKTISTADVQAGKSPDVTSNSTPFLSLIALDQLYRATRDNTR